MYIHEAHATARANGKETGSAQSERGTLAAVHGVWFLTSSWAINDTLELVTDGTNWYGQAIVSGGHDQAQVLRRTSDLGLP